jgi:hypothetical protein
MWISAAGPHSMTLPAPMVRVTPVGTVRSPVTRTLASAPQSVDVAIVPVADVQAGGASNVTVRAALRFAIRAVNAREPGSAPGASEPHPTPRRILIDADAVAQPLLHESDDGDLEPRRKAIGQDDDEAGPRELGRRRGNAWIGHPWRQAPLRVPALARPDDEADGPRCLRRGRRLRPLDEELVIVGPVDSHRLPRRGGHAVEKHRVGVAGLDGHPEGDAVGIDGLVRHPLDRDLSRKGPPQAHDGKQA